jgi:hypothetical protein
MYKHSNNEKRSKRAAKVKEQQKKKSRKRFMNCQFLFDEHANSSRAEYKHR